MERTLSKKFQRKIKNLTTPLTDHLGVTQFYHFQLCRSGHYVNVGLNSDYEQFYFSQPTLLATTPFFRHPEHYKNGITFVKTIQDQTFQEIIGRGSEKFKVDLSLQFTEKTSYGIQAFGFGLNSPTLIHHINLYNALPYLRLFIENFKEEFKPHNELLKDHQIDMAGLIGPTFYEPPVPITPKEFPKNLFLKNMNIAPISSLTTREVDVIKHLLKGYPASLIADLLSLSRRTVEHYIDNIKAKFNCTKKPDLIHILRKLESIDYFTNEIV